MTFDLISDLHLTFYTKDVLPGIKPSSKVLAILGDVCEIRQFGQLMPFFERVSNQWEYVLYVPGNHEFYCGHLSDTTRLMVGWLQRLPNIIVMDNDVVAIDGVRYICSTLWSDMDKSNPSVELACTDLISDYRYIRKDPIVADRKITTRDTVNLFNANVSFIKAMLELSEPNTPDVVLTHHAPSYLSVSTKYKGNVCNGAFVSDLSNLILDNPSIKVWAHGHTHSSADYTIGDCRVIANPYGYRKEVYQKEYDYKPVKVEVTK